MKTTQNDVNHYLLSELVRLRAKAEANEGVLRFLIEHYWPEAAEMLLQKVRVMERKRLEQLLIDHPLLRGDFDDLFQQLTSLD